MNYPDGMTAAQFAVLDGFVELETDKRCGFEAFAYEPCGAAMTLCVGRRESYYACADGHQTEWVEERDE